MKIICQKDLLVEALSNVTRAVSSKSPIMALEGVLLCAIDNQLFLTGYDLEMGITTTIRARTEQAGKIVLSARLLFDMIRRIPSEEILIESDDKHLTVIRGGATEYTILGIPAEDYPELPSVSDGSSFSMPAMTLKSMVDQTLFAIATTDSKPVHKGILFNVEEKETVLVAVDGFRLAIRKEPVGAAESLRFIVPGKTLGEVSKLIKEDKDDKEQPLKMLLSRKHIIFSIEGYSIISRLIEGEFLDYKNAVPNQTTTTVTVNTRILTESIERTSLLISEKIRSPLRIKFEEEEIEINCTTSIGKAFDTLPCTLEGNVLEMGFNNKYLLDALKASECDQVKLLINGPLSPMRIVPMESESFLFLVLPVRLKT